MSHVRGCEKESFHMLFHYPNACNSRGWAMQEPGVSSRAVCVAGTQLVKLAPAASLDLH